MDDVLAFPAGLWSFSSLDSLERGEALAYIRDIPTTGSSQVAFRVNEIGGYVQDQWLPTPGLTLSAGIRLDTRCGTAALRARCRVGDQYLRGRCRGL